MFSVSLKVANKNIQTRQKSQKEKYLFLKIFFSSNILLIRTFPFSDDFRKNFTTKTKTFGRNKLSVLESIAKTQLFFNPEPEFVPARQAENRYLVSLKDLQIRAQAKPS
jgi:hypothetical protein